eukprot:TRINITY_DN28764_c0_g3_i1.p1 TRINITY_DN28764_c0_g3~~TRINITY_DN28764_c0_g3_i1.p1  ORF type:complete len:135 (-),score=9.41 TRINITY_DN28764_c0_g3_i1:10-414(-)
MDCTCDVGYAKNGGVCDLIVCNADQWRNGSDCVDCTPLSHSPSNSTSEAACDCIVGYKKVQDLCELIVCMENLYLSGDDCLPCQANAHSPTNSTECTCDVGYLMGGSTCDMIVCEIGRAVQQECRDRSRMPSSA